jgi:hypothetical protein
MINQMKNFEIGQKVAVLDDVVEGIIIGINHQTISVETTDGFILKYQASELVALNQQVLKPNELMQNQHLFKGKHLEQKPKSVFKMDKNIPEVAFDLHVEKLVASYKGMSNFDILELQLETAKRHIEFAINKKIQKIVLIHGVGEGVLKSELEFLYRKYPQIVYQEANYQKYGQGASELYFKQNV